MGLVEGESFNEGVMVVLAVRDEAVPIKIVGLQFFVHKLFSIWLAPPKEKRMRCFLEKCQGKQTKRTLNGSIRVKKKGAAKKRLYIYI